MNPLHRDFARWAFDNGWLRLLVADAIRASHADGMQGFGFLRGGEAYKYRFANTDPGLETVLFSRAPSSLLAVAGAVLTGTPVPRCLRPMMADHA